MSKQSSIFIFTLLFVLASCSFDYGALEPSEIEMPDLVMEDVDYVRVRSTDPIARIQAERAERYESKGLMKLQNFSFEQYGERGEEVNASGKAGNAAVQINSGDVYMDSGVRIEVESEDIIIETDQLEWKDEPKTLSTAENNKVFIYQENGTGFSGTGLFVDVRSRKWEFKGFVNGTYIFEDQLDEEPALTEDEYDEYEDFPEAE